LNSKWVIINNEKEDYCTLSPMCDFLSEREAKRNKLLRQLATRTDKWMPNYKEEYIDFEWDPLDWENKSYRIMDYHMWLIFRNREEYNKYMTEEAKDLLFNP